MSCLMSLLLKQMLVLLLLTGASRSMSILQRDEATWIVNNMRRDFAYENDIGNMMFVSYSIFLEYDAQYFHPRCRPDFNRMPHLPYAYSLDNNTVEFSVNNRLQKIASRDHFKNILIDTWTTEMGCSRFEDCLDTEELYVSFLCLFNRSAGVERKGGRPCSKCPNSTVCDNRLCALLEQNIYTLLGEASMPSCFMGPVGVLHLAVVFIFS